MNKKIKFNIFKTLCISAVMLATCGSVFAKDIKIIPTRKADSSGRIAYRLYESPHISVVTKFFKNPDRYPGDPILSKGFTRDENTGAGSTSYHNQAYILSDAPLSSYPAGSGFGYITYKSYYEDVASGQAPNEFKKATKHFCGRPQNISDYDKHFIKEYPGYNYKKTGFGEWAYTLLCANHTVPDCDREYNTTHAYVSENYINKDMYDRMRNDTRGRTLYDNAEGSEYVYISEVKKVGRRNRIARTVADFYKITLDEEHGIWADTQKGATPSTASMSLINVYDNKLYFAPELESKLIIRYFDIANNGMNLEKDKTSFVTLNKLDKSYFTQEDLNNMLIGKEEIAYKPGDCFEIPNKDGMVILGSNKTTGGQKDYTGKPTINIGDINSTVICPTNSENTKDVYIDVFYNSKKRVYVRHINVTDKYNERTHEVTGLTPQSVNNSSRFNKTYTPFVDLFKASNSSYQGRQNTMVPLGGYQEEYSISVLDYAEAHNILNVKRDYIGYVMATDYNRTKALNKLNNNYRGTVKFNNQGNNENKDEDIRTFTAKDDEVTFIDMFYVINKDPKVPANPEDKIPGETPTNPNPGSPENPGSTPQGGCVEVGDGKDNGVKLTPKGSLYFESRVDGLKESTKNEFGKVLEEDKIPSGEDLYYGPLDVYPYMMGTAIYKDNKGNVYFSNGKNMSKVPYNFRSLDYLGFYTIKDNVEVYDNKSQTGGTLFANVDKTLRTPLSEAYLNDAASSHVEKGEYIPKIVTERREGGNEYYIDTYIDLTVKNDGVMFGKTNVVIPTYEKVYRKKIREDKYVNDGSGHFVLDKLSTKYFTQEEVPTIEEANHKTLVEAAIKKARTPETVKDMTYLYQGNVTNVPKEKYNGRRVLAGKLEYERNKGAFVDNSCNISDSVSMLTMNEKNKNTEPVLVLTPVIANMKLKSDNNFVDHTQNQIKDEVIQRNVPFEVTVLTNGLTHPSYPALKDYAKYTAKAEIKFSFALKFHKCYDANGKLVKNVPTSVPANTWIEVPAGGKIVTQAMYAEGEMAEKEEANSLEGTYTLKTYAVNYPKTPSFEEDARIDSLDLSDNRYNVVSKSHKKYHGIENLQKEIKYLARSSKKTLSLGRMYDFKITDIVDIDWKNVFRKEDALKHTGKFYYSGISKWNMYAQDYNQMEGRPEAEIGRNPQRILPAGPSKHTNLNYSKAPKLGYKFAFDLKTTGRIGDKTNKYIEIVPEYYFVSKDGKTFYDNSKIDLYYMNSSKKYVKVGSNVDKYQITMRPADGLRYISEYESTFNKTHLSKNTINIGTLSKIKLDMKTNLVENERNFVQLWYGEFKLPNSTIAVLKANPDLEHPLKDGYIGVKFNIRCVEKNDEREVILSYNTNDKNKPGVENTSQWDYERYMKVTAELPYDLLYKLEKGSWKIDNEMFQKVKGTVMLYDADGRAASDFDVGAGK